MGFLDRIMGRSAPPAPDLDHLFAIPDAAITLESAIGFRPTGVGSVCYRAPEGGAAGQTQDDVRALLATGGGPAVEVEPDTYGFTWLVSRHDPADVSGLVTDLHGGNTTLADNGFGPALLCSLICFVSAQRVLGLVYLYKRGTFYPFAPLTGQRRDSALELQVRGALAQDLRIEPDLSRWFAVWGAPGL